MENTSREASQKPNEDPSPDGHLETGSRAKDFFPTPIMK